MEITRLQDKLMQPMHEVVSPPWPPVSTSRYPGWFALARFFIVLVFFINPLVLVFFINPIGASEVDPGCIEFKPGDQPIHNTLLREGPSP